MQSTLIGAPARESWCRFRPLSAQDRPVMAAFRAVVEPDKGKLRGRAARAALAQAHSSRTTASRRSIRFRPPSRMREPASAVWRSEASAESQ